MPTNPMQRPKPRSLYQNTDAPEESSIEEASAQQEQPETMKTETPVVERTQTPTVSEQPMPVEQKPTQPPAPVITRPGQPLTHDRRSRVPFNDRYIKDNLMVDKRLAQAYFGYLSECRSKVEGHNAMILEFLISKGYDIDPHLLDKPIQPEDLAGK